MYVTSALDIYSINLNSDHDKCSTLFSNVYYNRRILQLSNRCDVKSAEGYKVRKTQNNLYDFFTFLL